MKRLVLALIAACTCLYVVSGFSRTLTLHAQQTTPPVFRSGTRLIVEDVTVKDKNGNPVEGLTAKDFAITEDGEPQTITFLEYQRLPAPVPAARDASRSLEAPAAQPTLPPADPRAASAAPRISSVPDGAIRYRDRRLVVLYFDATAMGPNDDMRAYSAAQKYIDSQMDSSVLMAIMVFDGGAVRVKSDFTDNHAQLQEVILRLIYHDDLDGDGIPDTPEQGTPFGQDDPEFAIFNTDRQLSALQTAVTMLQPLPEQKSLIYFASGLRLTGVDNQAQMRATTNAALRANTTIHSIDARGLVATAPLGDATRQSPGGINMFNGRTANDLSMSFQRSQDNLYALAKDTGGTAMFNYNDLSVGIQKAAESMSSYYIIGYYSTHTAPDGKFRKVKVSLNGGLSADVAFRPGYFADKVFAKFTTADKERQLEEALMLDNPITEITIAMELNYFQLNRAEYFVPLAVKIPGSELALARRGGAQRTLIDFIGEVKDDYGITIQNLHDKLDIKLSDATAAQLATRPIQYETGFTLLPGKYVIKFLARDSETGRIGTFQTAFTIPNLNREEKRLPMSSVVLSSQRIPLGDALFSVKKDAPENVNPLVHDGQKLFPSVTRVFSKARDLYVYFQAYERGATATQPLVAFVTFFRDGVKTFETTPQAVVDGMDTRSKAVPVRFDVPLQALAPGAYDCQVTVLDPTGTKANFWRAPIVIIP
ncbi:MAG TPA: VWA domain-containing protein [Vicinamibacterales bacterium]|nr:VWA domain-containing protein [Vicinamibacterales bacterium]